MPKTRKFINREISWLSFNERVMQEAADSSVPLVERFRFLGIFSNNRDEFFKVRVATIKRMLEFEQRASKIIGEDPVKLLNDIQRIVLKQQEKFESIQQEIVQELKKYNIHVINEKQLLPWHEEYIQDFFETKVLPELSPIILSNTEDFPELQDKSIFLAVKLTKKRRPTVFDYALVEVPTKAIGRFVILPSEGEKKYLILLDDVIRFCLDKVFSIFDFDQYEAHAIKFTRDAELDIDNDIAKSHLEKISKGVSKRKKGQPVRFIYDRDIPTDFLDYLIIKMDLDKYDHLIQGKRYHNSKDFMDFPNLGGESLEFAPMPSLQHPDIRCNDDILSIVEEKDVLLHPPYQGFNNFLKLLRQAAIDREVESIMITIYRVARNSRVMNALINAAQNGKKVTAVFELQARFDEESNIYWSKKLEEAGGNVVFGFPGLKVHAKLVHIRRRTKKGIKDCALIGTGNFHEQNARVFSDLLLFTSYRPIVAEVKKVFRLFDNHLRIWKYNHLMVSPTYMRREIFSLIDNEINNQKEGKPAYIILKLNNLVDKAVINKLYQANNAGVKIDLIVRGICSLIPGEKGMSENIKVISILDKFLEHARVFIFCNGGDELIYLSSADIMARNLDYRIEVATPVYDPDIREEIRTIINIQLKDNIKARVVNSKHNNRYKKRGRKHKPVRSQMELYKYYQDKLKK